VARLGWDTVEVDGNDVEAVGDALRRSRERNGRPKAIVLRTLPGKGVATLERREKAHFMRVEPHEWAQFHRELEGVDG
jgi:transketolase